MIKTLRIKNIDKDIVKYDLIRLGFQLIPANSNNRLSKSDCDIYCWFEGRGRCGNESPTLMIFGNTGIISFYMNTRYLYRALPVVLLDLFNMGMIECVEDE